MNKRGVVVLLPDGVGVRNFLLGPFVASYGAQRDLRVMHSISEKLLPSYQIPDNDRIQWQAMFEHVEGPLALTLRNSLMFAHLYWAKTWAMRFNLAKKTRGSLRRQISQRLARALGQLNGSSRGIERLSRWYHRAVSRGGAVAQYRQLFTETKTGLVFCSHQRPHTVVPAVLAARSLGVPTATFIFSWDNLTSKGRIPAPFDHYLVWSDLMKEELLRFYPDVSPDAIHLVGTPQFDLYRESSLLWSRETFFQRIGADPARPLICFSGGDTGTCPEDPQHLEILMGLIRSGRIRGNPNVVVRPAPVDTSDRYEPVRRRFPELLFAQPEWVWDHKQTWRDILPTKSDVAFLANLTKHTDLNINMASTMTLDFAVHDKPVVNLAFDAGDPPVFGKPIWDLYYHFDHYRHVVASGAARFARSSEQLADQVNTYLQDPSLDRENRKRLLELEVGWPIGSSHRRVIEVLEKLIEA